MKKDFLKELKWREMINNFTPDVDEFLRKNMGVAYVGIDPTADSLHIGHLVSIMMLKHFQESGHKPIVVLGGATGMIGDPSGKSKERSLLDENKLLYNQECIKKQLENFLDFNSSRKNGAILLNNYDWTKGYSFLDFTRDIGKHITVNYMMAKDSVKKRLSQETGEGMSFTEFTYQILQGFDFLYLNRTYDCKIQMGGADQWGNITTGIEMIRKIDQDVSYAITCNLITKADGGKFGKTEGGNIWLDRQKTSPYKFYQFWLNTSDKDAEKYIKIFTILDNEEIDNLILEHNESPHKRILQKKLAKEVTIMIHGEEKYQTSLDASEILFGDATKEKLNNISKDTILYEMEDIPNCQIEREELKGMSIIELLSTKTGFLPSKTEARKNLVSNAISINFDKIKEDYIISEQDFIHGSFIFLKRGKKNYFLVKIV